MRTSSLVSSWLLLLANIRIGYASSWATYTDAECQKSLNSVAGENGYPDGEACHIDSNISHRLLSYY